MARFLRKKWLISGRIFIIIVGIILGSIIGQFINAEPTEQSLPNPLQGQRFIDTWHAPRGGGRLHEGVDIFAKRNTPIQSTTSGIIVRIGRSSLGGNFVTVLGPGMKWHYYAHLERVPEGLHRFYWVNAGEVIGYVGDTGNAKGTPPHLHYGIYNSAKQAINPFPLINQTKGFE